MPPLRGAPSFFLVSVNGKSDPVVCKLMNAAQEEYRRKKMSRGNPAKKHQKKEIRMKVRRTHRTASACVHIL